MTCPRFPSSGTRSGRVWCRPRPCHREFLKGRSAPVTDLRCPGYRGDFLHHQHHLFVLVHRIPVFPSCVFMDHAPRRCAFPAFSLPLSCDQDHRPATITAEDRSHGFLHGLAPAPDYLEKTGCSPPVWHAGDCRTSGTVPSISTRRPGPGAGRSAVLYSRGDLLRFVITHKNPPSDVIVAPIHQSRAFFHSGISGQPWLQPVKSSFRKQGSWSQGTGDTSSSGRRQARGIPDPPKEYSLPGHLP